MWCCGYLGHESFISRASDSEVVYVSMTRDRVFIVSLAATGSVPSASNFDGHLPVSNALNDNVIATVVTA